LSKKFFRKFVFFGGSAGELVREEEDGWVSKEVSFLEFQCNSSLHRFNALFLVLDMIEIFLFAE
jgi:hypothetical protein